MIEVSQMFGLCVVVIWEQLASEVAAGSSNGRLTACCLIVDAKVFDVVDGELPDLDPEFVGQVEEAEGLVVVVSVVGV